MTFQHFTARLNWRQILVHFIAFWFFIHAFQTFSYLYNTRLVDAVRRSDNGLTGKVFTDSGIDMSDFANFIFWTSASGFIGLVVAFIISLIISIRRRWFWVNSLITFIITYLLYKIDLLGWDYLKMIFWSIGRKFNNSVVEFSVNGVILLTIGLLVFFLKRPNRFIEKHKPSTTKPPAMG